MDTDTIVKKENILEVLRLRKLNISALQIKFLLCNEFYRIRNERNEKFGIGYQACNSLNNCVEAGRNGGFDIMKILCLLV